MKISILNFSFFVQRRFYNNVHKLTREKEKKKTKIKEEKDTAIVKCCLNHDYHVEEEET
uniref:Uncharacterized protein n=1 Tax=Rhizophora mucronata TaxID=61149 RepID=A0A2P2ML43_RHIMU